MEFTCSFINCRNLYPPGMQPRRFAGNQTDLNLKIEHLAATLRASCDQRPPDLIGLCEVGEESLGTRVAEAVEPGYYRSVWSGQPPRRETGLMVLYNHAMFAEGVQRLDCSRSLQERVKWLAVLMTPRVASQVPLWFVVNHWQSPLSGASSPASRQNCWSEFSFFFQNEARMVADGLLVGGDFNIEPGDPPFVNQSGATLQPTRERQLVLRDRRNSSYLYNPMWRFMGEPEPHEDTLTEGYLPSRPLGTYLSGSGWRLYDQMFVSKSLLAGAYYHLLERTVRISLPQNACSDHCAIGARFGITEVR